MTDYPQWKPLAERTREALGLLGYKVPACLPGEPEACGGNFAEHAAAYLAALKAVIEVRIGHVEARVRFDVAPGEPCGACLGAHGQCTVCGDLGRRPIFPEEW